MRKKIKLRSRYESRALTRFFYFITLRFINGIYPLQVGGVRDYTLGYPNRDINDRTHRFMPFKGCIRNIIDNGRMYDLRFPLLNYNTEMGCSLFTNMFCPACYNGICDMSVLNMMTKSYACQCHHGWMGRNCDQRELFSTTVHQFFSVWHP